MTSDFTEKYCLNLAVVQTALLLFRPVREVDSDFEIYWDLVRSHSERGLEKEVDFYL